MHHPLYPGKGSAAQRIKPQDMEAGGKKKHVEKDEGVCAQMKEGGERKRRKLIKDFSKRKGSWGGKVGRKGEEGGDGTG